MKDATTALSHRIEPSKQRMLCVYLRNFVPFFHFLCAFVV